MDVIHEVRWQMWWQMLVCGWWKCSVCHRQETLVTPFVETDEGVAASLGGTHNVR